MKLKIPLLSLILTSSFLISLNTYSSWHGRGYTPIEQYGSFTDFFHTECDLDFDVRCDNANQNNKDGYRQDLTASYLYLANCEKDIACEAARYKNSSMAEAHTAFNNGDYKKAFDIFKPFAELAQGDAIAQQMLGQMYYKGKGVPQDYNQAVHWYSKSHKHGYVTSKELNQILSRGRVIGFNPNNFEYSDFRKEDYSASSSSVTRADGINKKIFYYPTGEVKAVGKYFNGKSLEATGYYKTGEVESNVVFVNSKISKVTIYYKTGEVREVDEYINGKPSKVTEVYKTGETIQVDKYINGKLSKATGYHKSGEVGKIIDVVNGKPSKVTIYYKTGEVREVDEYINGKPSKVTAYHKTGEVKAVGGLVNGKVSTLTMYYKTGEVESDKNIANGSPTKATHYHKTGEVKGVEEFVNGERLRIIYYYKTGEVKVIVEFVNGEKSKTTFYHKNGGVDQVQQHVNGKHPKTTFYHKTKEVKGAEPDYIQAASPNKKSVNLLGSEFSTEQISKNTSTSGFCNGFKAGFKAEFNRESGGDVEPFYSQCPLQPPKGKGLKSDYEYGYIFGVKQYNYESGSESGSKSYSRPPQFCEGFRDGYKSEFNRASRGSAEPFYSQCPQPFSGKEGYEDGYITGAKQFNYEFWL